VHPLPAATIGGAEGWHRLHPLSPVVRLGRAIPAGVAAIAIYLIDQRHGKGQGDLGASLTFYGVFFALIFVFAIVNWLVTRWRADGGTLRIERGLLKRSSIQVPISSIQAIDIVSPLVARFLGLSELRLRTGGASRADARLAYLRDEQAQVLRARLLAIAHGVHEDTPAPPETLLLSVPGTRLVASVLISSEGVIAVVGVAAAIALVNVSPGAAAAVGASAFSVLIGAVARVWRRVNTELGFSVAEAPDGLRVRSGLLQTVAETIPRGRIQSVRLQEPLLWRPFGWCRVELHVAGGEQRSEGRGGRRLARALLPVGSAEEAAALLRRLLPGLPPRGSRPPARARFKSPLRYHFLSGGHDESYAVGGTGRLTRVTTWVPLSKVQSIRTVEGPVQRMLHLATLHLDTPGRFHGASLVDRDGKEVAELAASLPSLCAAARKRDPGLPTGVPAVPGPPGPAPPVPSAEQPRDGIA
jgi:putative membrane protein